MGHLTLKILHKCVRVHAHMCPCSVLVRVTSVAFLARFFKPDFFGQIFWPDFLARFLTCWLVGLPLCPLPPAVHFLGSSRQRGERRGEFTSTSPCWLFYRIQGGKAGLRTDLWMEPQSGYFQAQGPMVSAGSVLPPPAHGLNAVAVRRLFSAGPRLSDLVSCQPCICTRLLFSGPIF